MNLMIIVYILSVYIKFTQIIIPFIHPTNTHFVSFATLIKLFFVKITDNTTKFSYF